jgi:hypothetical protein
MSSHSKLAVFFSAGVLATAVTVQAGSVPVFNGGLLLSTGAFFDGSKTLNLGDHDLIVTAEQYNRDAVLKWVTNLVAKALTDGHGIIGAGSANTGLAVLLNNDGSDNPLFGRFDDRNVNINTILVKHTWNGDTNLDGVINADDYFSIDVGFVSQLPGYRNGDLNYDGLINADDYFLMDSAFVGQTSTASDGSPILGIATYPAGAPVPLPASVWGGLALLAGLAVHRVARRD